MIYYTTSGINAGYYNCYGYLGMICDQIEQYDGITLVLSTKRACEIEQELEPLEECINDSYENRGLFLDNHTDQNIRQILQLATDVGFGDYLPSYGELKRTQEVYFSPDVPFFVIAACTGFFRLWDNHYNMLSIYNSLNHPCAYTKFAAAMSLYDQGDYYKVYPHQEHSVVPYMTLYPNCLDMFKTWNTRVSTLQSGRQEFNEVKYLSYRGRDQFFLGDIPPEDQHPFFELKGYQIYETVIITPEEVQQYLDTLN